MIDSPARGWRRVATAGGIAVLTLLVLGTVILRSYRSELQASAEREMLLLMSLRRAALETGLEQIQSEMALWSDFGRLKESVGLYTRAFHELGADAGARLSRLYVTESPFPEGRRQLLYDAGDGSAYSALHAQRQPGIEDFLEIHRYYDIFMIDRQGNVLYSYFKEEDFGTNLLDGPLAGTALADVFREASAASDPSHVTISDLERYGPSGDEPAMFVASASRDDDGTLLGVLAAQVGGHQVNQVLAFTSGMGDTGETYAVGDDLLLRSDSRFTEPSDVLTLTVDTESVRKALAGETGVHRSTDYRGEDVVSAYGLLEVHGIRWAIVADKDVSEVMATVRRLRRILLVTGAVVVLLVSLASVPDRARGEWLRSPELKRPAP